jgi:methionyl-tRNA formyltransferase
MGTPEYAAVSLARLLGGPHRVLAVVTRPDKPRGRGQQVEPSPTRRLADQAGIPVLAPASARDPAFLEALSALGADLGVVVAYGRILPRAALDAPRLGCINAHASLLPLLRGAAPIERAILAGLDRTGVTIMQMNEGLDEGDMLLARSIDIGHETTGDQLRRRLADLSADLLAEAVDLFAMADGAPGGVENSGLVVRTPQDHACATFAPPLRKEEAAITWASPATELLLRVRAFAPRPGAFCFDGATRVKVLAGRATDADLSTNSAPGTVLGTGDEGLRVACGRGVLEITTLQPEGKRAMAATDYERGRAAGPRVLRDGR